MERRARIKRREKIMRSATRAVRGLAIACNKVAFSANRAASAMARLNGLFESVFNQTPAEQ